MGAHQPDDDQQRQQQTDESEQQAHQASLPLDGRWRLGTHVVGHAVDAAHLVDDAAGHFFEQRIGQLGPVGGHEVAGLHRAQRDHIVVGAAITHHTHALDRQEHGEGLAGQLVPALAGIWIKGRTQLFDEDGVGPAQQVGVLLLHLAQNAHAQPRAGEGMAVDHVGRQAQRHAQLAHFVLEQFAQGLQQFQAELLGQATDVVMALDGDGLFALGAARLDHVGVDGALRQPLRALGAVAFELGRLSLEHIDEQPADDLSFFLGIGHARQLAQEQLAGVHTNHLGVQLAREHVHHQVALVQAQQAVIDEHAGEVVADGAVNQRCRHRRIDSARQTEDDLLITDLRANALHRFSDVIAHDPVATAAADLSHKTCEHGPALHGVSDFGVKLHGVVTARLVGHARDGATRRGRHELEPRGHIGHLVAVAHPHFEHAVAFGRTEILDAVEQPGVTAGAHFGITKLAVVAPFHLAAQLRRHGLHAIANAQHGHAQIPHGLRRAQFVVFVSAAVAARENDALGRELAHESIAHIARVNFAVHLRLAHAAGDELRDLGAEVEDENFVVHESKRRREADDGDGSSVDVIVGRFLRDLHVVDMTFTHARRSDLHKLGLAAHRLDRAAAAIAHGRTHATDQLVDDGDQRPFVRHAPFDALGHEFFVA